jgi:hypothetical protein
MVLYSFSKLPLLTADHMCNTLYTAPLLSNKPLAPPPLCVVCHASHCMINVKLYKGTSSSNSPGTPRPPVGINIRGKKYLK